MLVSTFTAATQPLVLAIRTPVPPAMTALAAGGLTSASAEGLTSAAVLGTASFWLGRSLLIRWIGGCYAVAFLVALRQNKLLLGDHGLLPVAPFLRKARANGEGFWTLPSVFWLCTDRPAAGQIDRMLDAHAWVGILLSLPLVVTGAGTAPQLVGLWALYMSLVNVGQRWYGFGWESQLLETGFLAIFLCPLRPTGPFPACLPPPPVVIWAFRWLFFRIMIGAGLIKYRGDRCWRPRPGDPCAMDFFYETQPVPNPLSRFFHFKPHLWHRVETAAGLWLVELLTPPLLLLPSVWHLGQVRTAAALLQIFFQFALIVSGNLAFLNWLTITPAFLCLSDAALAPAIPSAAAAAAATSVPLQATRSSMLLTVLHVCLALLLVHGSIPVVDNLLARKSRQQMNRSFGPFRIVNTYGAFGSVTRTRYEVILEGCLDEYPSDNAHWREYEFVVKPGDPTRAPRWLSPYHLRLDWLMWFLPFSSARNHPWFYHLIAKLLRNDHHTSRLLCHNPFMGGEPPRFVRAVLYEYSFAPPKQAKADGIYWHRRRTRIFLEPQCLRSLEPLLERQGWTT